MEGWTNEYKEELAMEMAVKSAEKAARSAALASFLHGFFGALPHGDVTHGGGIKTKPSRDGFHVNGSYVTFRGYFAIPLGFSRDGAYMGEEAESDAARGAQTQARRSQPGARAGLVSGHLVAPLHLPFWLWLRDRIIRCWVFVPCNFENISFRTFLKYKNSRKQELALWHLLNRLVPEYAK